MPTGEGILARARAHIGEQYRNKLIPKDDPNWKGPWDCAEFVSWLVFQESGVLYGCTDPNGNPATTEAYTGAWRTDARTRGRMISVEEAAATPGAMLLRYPPRDGEMGHIAVSDGKGGTVEAMGVDFGVAAGKVAKRRWDTGVLIPGIDYSHGAERVPVPAPETLYAIGLPNMSVEVVKRIQRALATKGFDPKGADGDFGDDTAAAVGRFQKAMGIIVDGEVGTDTARLLGVKLPAIVAPLADIALKSVVATNPLLAIATAVLPAIARLVAGDRGGAVAASASQAVAEITGATDPDAARARLDENPALQATLQIRLAEIANARERDRLEAESTARRDATAAEGQRRQDEVKELTERLRDVEDARASALRLSQAGGPSSWGPILISTIVTVGFFVLLFLFVAILLIYRGGVGADPTFLQIVNIGIGALTVAFSTVVTFWLGSSEGSRRKDAIAAENREQQADRDRQTVADSTSLAKEMMDKTVVPAAPEATATGEKPQFSNFERCLDAVFAREGGFSNHPNDRGGATMFGVTQATLADWRGDTVTEEDVRKLTRDEAREIYRSNYWNRLLGDKLPLGVDLMVFDFGVNAGPGASARILQKAVGAAEDGSIGDATVGATNAARPRATIEEFHKLKMERYRQMDGWDTFGNGWTARAEAIRTAALDMLAPTMIGPRSIAA